MKQEMACLECRCFKDAILGQDIKVCTCEHPRFVDTRSAEFQAYYKTEKAIRPKEGLRQ